jgi:hypothetical protein
MSILNILNELAAEPSKLAKIAILEREKNNATLKRVFQVTYDPYLNFWIKKIPDYEKTPVGLVSLDGSIDRLDALSSRQVTGNDAISRLIFILAECEEPEVIERIIQRDLRCGASESTPNKVWPNLIPTFDVMLAHKDVSGIKFPAYAQIKYDGGRCHLHFDGKTATAYSRNGKVIDFCGALDASASKLMKAGEVFDGEIVFRNSKGKLLDRKTSNGLFNSCIHINRKVQELENEICQLETELEKLNTKQLEM